MEVTQGLLNNLVQTRSMEKVLAPIANQVSQLILLNEAYENGEREGYPTDLTPSAGMVKQAATSLAYAATRLANDTHDEDLKREMPKACEMLTVAGESFLFATQNAQIQNFNQKSRKHLVRAAKEVLEGTLKVLMVSDDGEVRKIVKSGRWVLDRLALLTGVKTHSGLLPVFKSFAESTLLLTTLANRRQADLSNPTQREALIDALTTLRKSVPLLSTAMQTYVRFPENTQAKASKDYAVGHIAECVSAIIDIVQNKVQDDDTSDLEEPGKFISAIDKLLDSLHEDKRKDLMSGNHDVELHLEVALRHSMAVAHASGDKHKNLITKISQRTLQQKNTILKVASTLNANPGNTDLKEELDEACDRMVVEVTDLENHVNKAVLHLVVVTFRETIEPLERTVKAALKPRLEGEINSDVEAEEAMEPYTQAFYSHSDALTQAATFLCAGSPDARKVRQVRGCLRHLSSLDPELVPAITACCRHLKDQAAIQHLRMLKEEWSKTIELLVGYIDDMIEPAEYINIAVAVMNSDVGLLKNSVCTEALQIVEISRLVVGGGLRISQVALRVIDNHSDAIYRNGVMVHVNQLKKVLQAVKSTVTKVVNDLGNLGLHETLHKRCDLLLKCVGHVRDALKGQGHPDLLSDLRTNARGVAAKINMLNFDEDENEGEVDGAPVTRESDSKLTAQRTSKPEVIHNKAAVRNYISELVTSNLKDLTRSLVTAAIAGQQNQMSLLSNDILAYSNHITDSANRIAPYCSNEQSLKEGSSRVFSVTPQLMDKAQKVCDMDTYQMESMHVLATQWAQRVSHLESLIDGQVTKWKVVSDKVVDAAMMNNSRLLNAQSQYIQQHQQKLASLVAMVTGSGCHSNVVVAKLTEDLKGLCEEVDNQTTMLTSLAHLTVQSGKISEKNHLDQASREWAVKVFVSTGLMKSIAVAKVTEVIGQYENVVTGQELNLSQDEYSNCEKACAALFRYVLEMKQLLISSKQSVAPEQRSTIDKTLDDLDLVTSDLRDCVKAIMYSDLPYHAVDRVFSVHKMFTVQCSWALQAQRASTLLDSITDDFMRPLHTLTSDGSLESWRSNSRSAIGKLSDIAHGLNDLQLKDKIKEQLSDLSDLTNNLSKALKENNEKGRILLLKRKWAQAAFVLTKTLETDKIITKRGPITEALAMLRSYCDNMSPAVIPVLKNPRVKVTPDTGFKTSTPASEWRGKPMHFGPVPIESQPDSTEVYKSLKSGPQMSHQTPDPPSRNSGYKPLGKRLLHERTSSSRLQPEVDRWDEENNAIVRVAKEMTQQLNSMTQFFKSPDDDKKPDKDELIKTAKAIAENGQKLVQFAKILASYCVDKRFSADLMFYAEHVPCIATQLNILASVRAATPDDRSSEKMLVQNSENLISAIGRMLRAAEATSVKGFNCPPEDATDEVEAVVLATEWNKKYANHRALQTSRASTDELGLRRVDWSDRAPTLTQYIKK